MYKMRNTYLFQECWPQRTAWIGGPVADNHSACQGRFPLLQVVKPLGTIQADPA